MRFSNAFIPTVKEAPKDATSPSHIFLIRGGYVRMIGSGLYEMLPLGFRVLKKIMAIVRDEMDGAGAQEVLMPGLLPATYFKETGRYDGFGDTLLRLKDRKGGEYHLGPTHEEIITDMVRREVKSYRHLPINLYQIQMKYRDEPRPRAGLLRCREFLMKDAYSFDTCHEDALKSYAIMREAYKRIFTRLGLDFRIVKADSGAMGGDTSAEFQVLAQTGEDDIVACHACEYAANVEVATAKRQDDATSDESPGDLAKVHTPGVGSIEDVVGFFQKNDHSHIDATRVLKSLVYLSKSGQGADAKEEIVLAVVRGDHEVNEIKLTRALGATEVLLANEKTVRQATGAGIGFAGPVDAKVRVLIDESAAAVKNAATGANEQDHHLVNVNHGRDFEGEVVDLRSVTDGDPCPNCGEPLASFRGIEGGHIFVLGTHYSAKMGAEFLNAEGKRNPVVMGCYGIGVSRLMASAIEQHHDEGGIIWPMAIAPYQVIITTLGKGKKKDEAAEAEATKIYEALRAEGLEVLLDDRKERPGVKFKDADLIGVPLRVTVGGRGLGEGVVEYKKRGGGDLEKIPLDTIVARVISDVRAELP